MSLHRRNAKRDGNEDEIVYALIQAGATVAEISAKGVPDLLVGYQGRTYLLECKMPKSGRLTKAQREFHRDWRGAEIGIVRSIGEALEFIGAVSPEWRHEP